MTNVLELAEVGHSYTSGREEFLAVENVSFSVKEGEFVSVVGPSGSGKSTLLRSIAGLEPPSLGTIRLEGRQVLRPPRGMALVFQDYSRSLFPWMTVARNVGFPLQGCTRHDRAEKVTRALESVGLATHGSKYPWQLSGGMQQRVAIARALAFEPRVLLMDEPFAAVDAQTRSDLEDLMLRVHSEFKISILFVTHDIDESVYLADRVLVLSKSPGTLVADIPVSLPRPRDQIETKSSPAYVETRASVAALIRRAENAVGASDERP